MTGAIAVMASYGASGPAPAALVMNLDAATYTGLSASFNGTSQYLSASNAAFTFAGDFTVEGWYRPTSVAGLRTLFTIGAPTAATGALVVYSSSGTLQAQPYGGGNTAFSGATMSINTWYHVALVRSGSTIKLYFNGTANATTITNSSSVGNDAFTVGFLSGGYGYFAGQISTVRVSASAVYTGNFIPSTSALTTNANTVALLPLTATPFTDISTNAITVTNTGTVVPIMLSPFISSSLSFGGGGVRSNYLSMSPGMNFGAAGSTTPYTIETFFYATALTGTRGFIGNNGSVNNGLNIYINAAGTQVTLDCSGGGGTVYFPLSTAITLNVWHHIAVTRNASSQTQCFVDGIKSSNAVSTATYNASANITDIGSYFGNNWQGNLSNFRIVVGSNVYDPTAGSITVPTAALTAVANTKYLMLGASATTDSSGTQTVTVGAGTVGTSSLVPVGSSAVSDATGNYPITVVNPGSLISWNSANSGVFRVANAASNSTNFMTFGPNYSSTTQAYTVMMVYRSLSGTTGRLLNANSASPDWLMGLYSSGSGVQDIFFNGSFVGSSSTAQDGTWRFGWFTFNGTNTTNAYVAGGTAPTTTYGTKAGTGGFNGLRLFGRYNSSTTIVEQVTADVGLVKVWDGALTLAQIQAEHATYKTRFGY